MPSPCLPPVHPPNPCRPCPPPNPHFLSPLPTLQVNIPEDPTVKEFEQQRAIMAGLDIGTPRAPAPGAATAFGPPSQQVGCAGGWQPSSLHTERLSALCWLRRWSQPSYRRNQHLQGVRAGAALACPAVQGSMWVCRDWLWRGGLQLAD